MGRFSLKAIAGWIGIVAGACLVNAAHADTIIERELFYTRYSTFDATESNVKKVKTTYNKTTGNFFASNYVNIARTNGADGIVVDPTTPVDDPSVFIGGQNTGFIHRVKVSDGSIVSQLTNVGASFHITIDPSKTKAWTGGLPGGLSEVPITPFGAGVARAVTGDDTNITQILPVPDGIGGYKWFYTASDSGGVGSFGTFNINTFVTTRVLANFTGAHGMQYDPYTGHIIMSGEQFITQIDPNTNPPSILHQLDLSSIDTQMDLDQCAVDGKGLIYGASNNGQLVLVDYAASRNVAAATNVVKVIFLDTFLDDIAPILDPAVRAPCCPIGTGDFDGQAAQISQLPFTSADTFDFRVADDFYLPPGEISRVRTIEATLLTTITDPILRKAGVELYEECDGKPGAQILFNAANVVNATGPTEPTITITPTGQTFNGNAVVKVTATFPNLWLKGGKNYWVSFFGKSDGPLVWSWGTAGNRTIQGKPGLFRSISNGFPDWTSIDQICCGCTDFAFCVTAESCKILYDGGKYDLAGSASLAPLNAPFTDGRTVKSADNFVVPPCANVDLCYLEAYIITNCTGAALDIYANECNRPVENASVIATLTPSRIIHTGRFVTINNQRLEVLCLQFYDVNLRLIGGRDYWVSPYGIISGNLNQQSYFAYNVNCKNPCLIKFGQGYIKGQAISRTTWTPSNIITGAPHDYSFLIATKPVVVEGSGNGSAAACSIDVDRNGRVNLDDLFGFISIWFQGCP